MSFDKVLNEVSKSRDVTQDSDRIRILNAAPLLSGIPGRLSEATRVSQTVRISSGGDNSFKAGTNQNDRAQVPPDTLNKVPRLYGTVTTGGVIFDAATEANGNVLVYAIALSEMDADRFDSNNGVVDRPFTIQAVYRNNYECNFLGLNHQVYTLTSIVDNSTVDIPDDLIEVYVWANSSLSSDQIFPVYSSSSTNRENAYDLFPGWDSNVVCEGLVFAIVKVKRYEVEGEDFEIKDFGEFKFTVESEGLYFNSGFPDYTVDDRPLNNPAWALYDYLTSERYGVGLLDSDLDYSSFTDWEAACDEATFFKREDGGIFAQPKFRINGFINTQNPVSQNIDAICAAGMATFTYDNKQGKFRVLPNRKMTSAEKTNAFHFTGDNIVSSITVNTTDIYSLFNFAEVSFPNTLQLDIADNIIVQTPTADKLQNEPTTGTSISLPTVSDRSRAADIGNVTLKQSRLGTIVQLTGDHSTMVVDVGDFVKVTDQAKGWSEKYFRVLRITESQQQGVITCRFTLSEYNDRVFEDIIYEDTTNKSLASGVGLGVNYADDGSLNFDDIYLTFTPDPGAPFADDLYIVEDPATDTAKIYNLDTGAQTGTTTISGLPASISNISDLTAQSYLVINTGLDVSGGEPDFSTVTVTFENQTANRANITAQTEFAPQFENFCTGIPLDKLADGDSYKIKIQYDYTDVIPSKQSQLYTSAAITINDETVNGAVPTDTYGPGTVITQDAVSFITGDFTVDNTAEIITTPIKHDITGITTGEFVLSGTYTPSWTQSTASPGIQPDDYIQYTPSGNVIFSNKTNLETVTVEFNAGGFYANGAVIGNVSLTPNGVEQTFEKTVQLDPAFYGLTSDWYPARLNMFMAVKHDTLYNRISTATLTDFDYQLVNQSKLYRD